MARIIDGNALAQGIKQQVQTGVAELRGRGRNVRLVAIIIGVTPAAQMYAKRQGEACAAVGIGYELLTLPAELMQHAAFAEIDRLNADSSGHRHHGPSARPAAG